MTDLATKVKAFAADPETHATSRTLAQNRALHMYCQMVADDMNAAGYDAQKVISLPIQLTAAIVKDQIFRPIMTALIEKESTTELDTKEVNQVVENMQRALAQKFGITTPFPDRHGDE